MIGPFGRVGFPLKGKVVAITGGAGGIGSALARRFAARGARLALVDLMGDAVEALAATLRAEGHDAQGFAADLCDPEATELAVAAIEAAFGGIDVLINNAGITHRSPFQDTKVSVVRKVMEVNYFGAVHMTHAALPSLLKRKGQITAISSVAGFAPLIGRTGYAASKHALHGFFDTLRAEVAHQGVSVLIVCPCFTDTQIAKKALGGDGGRVRHAQAKIGKPASPADVAEMIVRSIERKKRLLVLSGVGKAAWWISRVWPRAYSRLMSRTQKSELPVAAV
ncbi:MAG: SDR family oxidoreductase [Planctomycetota bacterium]|jgi:NAD(P)-dependent dehydrogenase (short-subunit alcohol dehydrogenase family)